MSAHACESGCKVDLVGSRGAWVLWGAPAVLFLLGAAWPAMRAWVWTPSLVVAGAACLANALRCGRLHCFITGPVFLLGGIATLVDVIGVAAIGWQWIFVAVLVGTAAAFGIEWVRGKYVGTLNAQGSSTP